MSRATIDEVCDDCLVEMFRRVGLDMPDGESCRLWADNHGDRWYEDRVWTEADQQDFAAWMRDYLKKRLRWRGKTLEYETGMFLLCYGWITTEALAAREEAGDE